ncbi:MAG: exosortase system-associated protein, TIGR04073 family [Candidatus Omnitrophota bacterium]
MKKNFLAIAALFVAMAMATGVYADGLKTGFSAQGSRDKLVRGVLNIADSVVEIPGTMMRKSQKEGIVSGMILGPVEGVLNTVKRALAGVWEVVAFPIPIPENYEPILSDPEFLNVN